MSAGRHARDVTVSVVLPAYNGEETIEQCLQSIRGSVCSDYELIVVVDGSSDATPQIAGKYADHVILNEKNQGRGATKDRGAAVANGDVVVFVDQDMMVKPDTLGTIIDYFSRHPDVAAVTGTYAKEHPNKDFFSQYKNLYMHFILSRFPERVTFLSTIYAVRRSALIAHDPGAFAEDTELAQRMTDSGRRIAFLRELQVIHLKKYSFSGFVRNDFEIPRSWAKILVASGAWRQIGARNTGFHHASKAQLASVLLAPAILGLLLLAVGGYAVSLPLLALLVLWYSLNHLFLAYLVRARGLVFGTLALPATFLDHLVMAAGVLTGTISSITQPRTSD